MTTALLCGYPLLIVLVSLTAPAIRQWWQVSSEAGYSLLKSILTAAFRVALFYVCLIPAGYIVLLYLMQGSNAPLAMLFIPEWVEIVIVSVAITMQWTLPWCVKAAVVGCREIQEVYAAERVLLSHLQTDSEPLLKFASQVVRTTLANTVGRESVQYALAKIDTDCVKLVGPKMWTVWDRKCVGCQYGPGTPCQKGAR
ncbi:MAG: hypothetical protein WCJ09_07570 [Planctomycetota bacterium]